MRNSREVGKKKYALATNRKGRKRGKKLNARDLIVIISSKVKVSAFCRF